MFATAASLFASSSASGAVPAGDLSRMHVQQAHIVLTYTDNTVNTLPVTMNGTQTVDDGVTSVTVKAEGVNSNTNEYTVTLKAISQKELKFADCHLAFTPEMTSDDVRVFANSDTTNSRITVRSFANSNGQMSKDVGAWSNRKTGALLGIALTTVDRFWSYLRNTEDGVRVRYAMEDKPLETGKNYRLEKFILSTPSKVDQLFSTYTGIMAKRYHVKVNKQIPTGWCSWSCCYGNLSADVIKDVHQQLMANYGQAKPNTLQLDDGWQRGNSFGGYWTPRWEGLQDVSAKVRESNVTFGLWLAPFITNKSSGFYNDYPQYKYNKIKESAAEYSLSIGPEDYCYPMAIDKQQTLDYFRSVFERATSEYGAQYFKLDFLLMGLRSAYSNEQLVIYPDDYIVALYRRALKTIRGAVGKDAFLLACGAPIPESIGVFDGIRVTEDITQYGTESKNQWNLIKWCSNNIALRYFYHGKLFVNDPDGLVVRDYDIGDSAVIPYNEAQVWATSVAFSGGSSLINEFIGKIGDDRKWLYRHILPVLGKAGRPVDYFEDGQPSTLVVDLDDGSKLVAVYNWSDEDTSKSVALDELGLNGTCIVYDGWKSAFVGTTAMSLDVVMPKRSSKVFRVCRLNGMPQLVAANTSLFSGAEVFKSSYSADTLTVSANSKLGACEGHDAYIYLPKGYKIDGSNVVWSDADGCVVSVSVLRTGRKTYHVTK